MQGRERRVMSQQLEFDCLQLYKVVFLVGRRSSCVLSNNKHIATNCVSRAAYDFTIDGPIGIIGSKHILCRWNFEFPV
jgi:hypothetical protein